MLQSAVPVDPQVFAAQFPCHSENKNLNQNSHGSISRRMRTLIQKQSPANAPFRWNQTFMRHVYYHENPHLQIESLLLYLVPTNGSIPSLTPGMVSNIREMKFKLSNGANTRIAAPITKQIHAVVD